MAAGVAAGCAPRLAESGAGPGAPAIAELAIHASPSSVLAASITLRTAAASTCTVAVRNLTPGNEANAFEIGPLTGPATTHDIPVLGLRASSSFELVVTARDAQGRASSATLSFATGPLPGNFPPVRATILDRGRVGPGLTLFTVWKWRFRPALPDPTASYLVALDGEGKVVWYYRAGPGVDGAPGSPLKLPNGHIAFLVGDTGWAEIDPAGHLVQAHPVTSGLDTLHHDLSLAPGGGFLTLATELRDVPGYPLPDGGTATYHVVGDVVATLAPDGVLVGRRSSFDFLGAHVLRTGLQYAFDYPFWDKIYKNVSGTKDWTHGNSISVDPADGGILYSSRTQSWIVKLDGDPSRPRVLWRLGAGGDFTLTNPGETFQYNQHAAHVTSRGTVMCFDNGNARPHAGDPLPFSRAVEFALDTRRMTATIVWQYREEPSFYSTFLGSAYDVPGGNVLVCDGGEVDNRFAPPSEPTNLKSARILEVTRDARPTKVLEIDVRAPLGSIPEQPLFSGYSVYRATRIASLY